MKNYIQMPQSKFASRDRPIEVVVEQQHELSRGVLLEGKSNLTSLGHTIVSTFMRAICSMRVTLNKQKYRGAKASQLLSSL